MSGAITARFACARAGEEWGAGGGCDGCGGGCGCGGGGGAVRALGSMMEEGGEHARDAALLPCDTRRITVQNKHSYRFTSKPLTKAPFIFDMCWRFFNFFASLLCSSLWGCGSHDTVWYVY